MPTERAEAALAKTSICAGAEIKATEGQALEDEHRKFYNIASQGSKPTKLQVGERFVSVFSILQGGGEGRNFIAETASGEDE